MKIKTITVLKQVKFVPKVDKYIATLNFHGEPERDYWISEKQAKNLDKTFGDSAYSTKSNTVYGVFDDSGDKERFVWCASNDHGKEFLESRFMK